MNSVINLVLNCAAGRAPSWPGPSPSFSRPFQLVPRLPLLINLRDIGSTPLVSRGTTGVPVALVFGKLAGVARHICIQELPVPPGCPLDLLACLAGLPACLPACLPANTPHSATTLPQLQLPVHSPASFAQAASHLSTVLAARLEHNPAAFLIGQLRDTVCIPGCVHLLAVLQPRQGVRWSPDLDLTATFVHTSIEEVRLASCIHLLPCCSARACLGAPTAAWLACNPGGSSVFCPRQ